MLCGIRLVFEADPCSDRIRNTKLYFFSNFHFLQTDIVFIGLAATRNQNTIFAVLNLRFMAGSYPPNYNLWRVVTRQLDMEWISISIIDIERDNIISIVVHRRRRRRRPCPLATVPPTNVAG